MFGVVLNAVGIVVGGMAGLMRNKPLRPAAESFWKTGIGVAALVVGFQMVWKNMGGGFGTCLKQFFIVLISMSLGKFLGRFLRFQTFSNRIGQAANARISRTLSGNRNFSDGFLATALLACANPLSVLGAVNEGLSGFSLVFVLKTAIDGLAAFSFVLFFGRSVLLGSIPVLAFQGTVYLLVAALRPFLETYALIPSVNATAGLLVVASSMVVLNLKKIELADYLPSLAVAPLITWLWR